MSEETRILGSSIPFVDLVPDSLVQTIYVVVVRLVYVRTPSSQTTNAEIWDLSAERLLPVSKWRNLPLSYQARPSCPKREEVSVNNRVQIRRGSVVISNLVLLYPLTRSSHKRRIRNDFLSKQLRDRKKASYLVTKVTFTSCHSNYNSTTYKITTYSLEAWSWKFYLPHCKFPHYDGKKWGKNSLGR